MIELLGRKFGKLLVVSETNKRTKAGGVIWVCCCDCGNKKELSSRHLLHDNIKSCGCLLKWKNPNYIKKEFYTVWHNMIDRCENQKNKSYKNYGAKGISVCDEWRNDYWVFHKWAKENGLKKGLSVDRFPNQKGNYSPTNCRIATPTMQNNNRKDNVLMQLNGITKTISEWAAYFNQNPSIIFSRLRDGWNLKDALETKIAPPAYLKRTRNKFGQFK